MKFLSKTFVIFAALISFKVIAAEDNVRRPIIIANTSSKHLGVNVQGRLFLLRCNNANCDDCRNSRFANQINLGINGPTKIKATYGSFKSLSRNGYREFPNLPKNAFIAIESALFITTAFAAAGYYMPAFHNILAETAKKCVPDDMACVKAAWDKSLDCFVNCSFESAKNPVILGSLNFLQNLNSIRKCKNNLAVQNSKQICA
ncbi:MAG: hypothetical protein AB8G05_23945 [Oligoflexales bacterium]